MVPTFFRQAGPRLPGPPLLLVCTTCLHTESAYHSRGCGESAGLGSGSSSRLCCFLFAWPWAFPCPSWGLQVSSAFLVCQRGQGGEDGMVKPHPGWGLSFLSHLPWCYVYTALSPSSCVYTTDTEQGQLWTGPQRGCGASRRKGRGMHELGTPIVHRHLAGITSFHPGYCPLWQLVFSSFHREGN